MTLAGHPLDDDPLLPGRVLGGYRLEGFLGRGGFAYGLTAVRVADGARVVCKTIRRVHRGDPDRIAALLREGALLRRAAHPNVMPCLDVVQAEGWTLLVLPWLGGGTLRDLVGAPLDPARVVGLLQDALAGLGHLHACGIVHRDVKPGNLHLGDDGTCRVADLGLAVAPGRRHGRGAGTRGYRAPEGEEGWVDERADVFGLGATAHWLLARALPERDGVARARIDARIPPALSRWLAQCLAVDPERRYPSAARCAAALAAAAEQDELDA